MSESKFRSVSRFFVFLFFIVATIIVPTMAQGSSPRSFVKSMESEMRALLRLGNVSKANALFARYFDMSVFGKRCLADHWNEFTPSERERFLDLLSRNIQKNIADKMLLTSEDVDFQLIPKRVGREEGLTRIDSSLRVKKGSFILGILLKSAGPQWYVADYDFDGALLSRNYRGHFNFLIRRYGKEVFFAKLEKRLQDKPKIAGMQ